MPLHPLYSRGSRSFIVVGSNRLWLRSQVWLTGIEIDRDRDVFVDHQPIAADLLVNVGHAYGQIQLLALLIGASDALDAVAVGKIVVGGDVEVVNSKMIGPLKLSRNACQSLR